jgi:membrane-associated phospholipid phosphatase
MSNAWALLSELGNSKWLLPAATVLILVSAAGGNLPWRTASRWGAAIAVAATIVLVSKIAFMGWGIGSAALDFTGFSGHATMAASIYPPLAVLLGAGSKISRRWLIASGGLLALAIAYSRLPLNAHSVSEIVSGLLLGGLASAVTLSAWPAQTLPLPAWKWLGPALLVLGLHTMPPQASTHQLVVALAKYLSGRDKTYQRQWLHQNSVTSGKQSEIAPQR